MATAIATSAHGSPDPLPKRRPSTVTAMSPDQRSDPRLDKLAAPSPLAVLRTAALFAPVFAVTAAPMVVAGMPPYVLAVTVVLGVALVVLTAVDILTLRLPDLLTLPLLALGLTTSAVTEGAIVWHVAAAAAGYALLAGTGWLFRQRRGYDGLGLGDAKLLAAGGAWVGLMGLPTVLVIGCFTALAIVVARRLAGIAITAGEPMAFGPFLSFGIWYTWLYGALA